MIFSKRMTTTPWRELATPHQDVLKGTFQDAEFAVDISQVHRGKATAEYQNGAEFFARTFITEGMRLLLDSVVRRLAGQGGDPIIQLQTAFGGGKTHTMLAVYHLVRGEYPASQLQGVAPIVDAAGVAELPQARVAVIDGTNLSPSQPKTHGRHSVHTLWGELAWQLNGETGYELVRDADASGTCPSKETVIELLSQASPCVILMDELVAFYRQFDPGKTYAAGSFETNMSFVQILTESVKAVPKAILLASLPDSHNAGEGRGQAVLAELESYFRRLQKIWKPVTKDEAFSIVRRRLFESIEDTKAMTAICRSFAGCYISQQSEFPAETQEAQYLERMKQAFPIHPELFDRLYEDWATLENFQRTRGVLQLLAQVIHRLWKDGNSDPLIMPGSIPLYDATVRNKFLDYLPQGWEPVIDQDIDGEGSRPAELDRQPIFGKIQAARRVARTIFLGSAPATSGKMTRGIPTDHVLLGVVQPGQTPGHYKDALGHLRDALNYLNSDSTRLWFGITPNLRREMEGRKQRFHYQDDVLPELAKQIKSVFGNTHGFGGIHVFTASADIPDDYASGPRLAILKPDAAYSKSQKNNLALVEAERILRTRGDQPRQRQNRLLFLAPDYDLKPRLVEQTRSYLAWGSIVADIDNDKLVLDTIQVKQARSNQDDAQRTLRQLVRDTYKWLLSPFEEMVREKPALKWEAVPLSFATHDPVRELEQRLKDEEWLIAEWSPIHLAKHLEAWYLKNGAVDISAQKVWQDSCHYLYMPRLANQSVFEAAIARGIETEDFFAYASGKDGDKYLGFAFGRATHPVLDGDALLIDATRARDYKARSQAPAAENGSLFDTLPSDDEKAHAPIAAAERTRTSSAPATLTQFYGIVEINPIKAKMDFATIVDEVVEQFTVRPNAKVQIVVEIRAQCDRGFDEATRRAVRENCNSLGFRNNEFEE